ncbi:hypothetical protein Msi02_49590 [Microbispora siamensis]|uniref:Uncharacterized protein n=1 Tax=Microbispora siamensis TaxID=564413 RepID=A0ABQ4GRU0_9ACTN|nr:hypothetical protein Msi02_49590 [Microbispora siamensis]
MPGFRVGAVVAEPVGMSAVGVPEAAGSADGSAGDAGAVTVTVAVTVGEAEVPEAPEHALSDRRATAAAGTPARRKRSRVVITG